MMITYDMTIMELLSFILAIVSLVVTILVAIFTGSTSSAVKQVNNSNLAIHKKLQEIHKTLEHNEIRTTSEYNHEPKQIYRTPQQQHIAP